MWLTFLIVHGLLAVLLLGAITHQAVHVTWRPGRKRQFVESFATIRGPLYANAVVILYIVVFVLGGLIYAYYRYTVKPTLEDLSFDTEVGLFELKEHFAAVGLVLLPAYWMLWRRVPQSQQRSARGGLTILLAFICWFSLVIGHIVNNTRGFSIL